MDTQSDSSGALDTNQAAAAFGDLLNPPEKPDKVEADAEDAPKEESKAEDAQANPEAEPKTSTEDDDPVVTVKIDGKDVEVKLSDLKRSYGKETAAHQRFDQAAELRKTADAEIQKAQQERQIYAQNLQRLQAQTEAALQEQQQIDWQALLEADPVEYLKQQHLAQTRQAKLNQVYAEQQRIAQVTQAEHAERLQKHVQEQHQALLDKLPEWRDEARAKADKIALRDYLLKQGYTEDAVNNVTDAKTVVLALKAMRAEQTEARAKAAAKKVQELPAKTLRPGMGDNPNLDRRSAAFKQLSKSGRIEDAAAAFSLLNS